MAEVAAVVVIFKKARAAIVPSLDDVQRGADKSQASASGHGWRVESSMNPTTQLPPSGLQTVVCPRFSAFAPDAVEGSGEDHRRAEHDGELERLGVKEHTHHRDQGQP